MAVSPIPPGPRITPYLLYEDVAAALEWLAKAFGFVEFGDRFAGPDGKVTHASMKLGDGVVMMGCPGPAYKNPTHLGQATQHLYVYVEDVDAAFERACNMGARVIEAPKDEFYGDRRCGLADPEGHQWWLAQHVRDVSPEEMRAAAGATSDVGRS
jgi:PhnB protein